MIGETLSYFNTIRYTYLLINDFSLQIAKPYKIIKTKISSKDEYFHYRDDRTDLQTLLNETSKYNKSAFVRLLKMYRNAPLDDTTLTK